MEVYKLSLDSNVLHAGPTGYRINLAFAQTPDTLFSGTSNYTISLWAKRNAFTNTDYTLFRIISSSKYLEFNQRKYLTFFSVQIQDPGLPLL